jgi:transcriptional regulator with XRE-family HTH domain
LIVTYITYNRNEAHTADDQFVIKFAAALAIAYQEAKSDGVSDEKFAADIGVERPQLRKYLSGEAMPCVRTVAMARKNFGVRVPYEDEDITAGMKDQRPGIKPTQLTLPLTIKTFGSDQMNLRIKSSSISRVDLELVVRRVG